MLWQPSLPCLYFSSLQIHPQCRMYDSRFQGTFLSHLDLNFKTWYCTETCKNILSTKQWPANSFCLHSSINLQAMCSHYKNVCKHYSEEKHIANIPEAILVFKITGSTSKMQQLLYFLKTWAYICKSVKPKEGCSNKELIFGECLYWSVSWF